METAFVTGGSGFVGRNLIAALIAKKRKVLALVRSDASERAVREAGASPVRGDLDDLEALDAGLRGATIVYHAAATVEDWGRPEHFRRVNVLGTENVLRAARRAGVGKFVHVSTEAVLLGGAPIVRATEDRPRSARPIGLYPATKAEAEAIVVEANGPELTTIVVRPRFIWGVGDTSLLPKLVSAVKSGSFRWIGGGRHLTSSCHVKNVAEGMIRAGEAGRGGEIYFLTDGEPVELRAFLTAMLGTQGVDPGDREIPRWLALPAAHMAELVWRVLGLASSPPITRTAVKLIGEEVTVVDEKARRELGYHPVITRERGLEEMRAHRAPAPAPAATPTETSQQTSAGRAQSQSRA